MRVAVAALDLHGFSYKLPVPAVQEDGHCLALGFKAQTALALAAVLTR
jgi:hypothetical protein